MKNAVIAITVITVIALLSLGAVSYAGMMGEGRGHDAPMMRGHYSPEEQKLLDATADLRRDINLKMFELKEALRKGEYQRAETIDKELQALKIKLYEKTGSKGIGRHGCGCRCMAEES